MRASLAQGTPHVALVVEAVGQYRHPGSQAVRIIAVKELRRGNDLVWNLLRRFQDVDLIRLADGPLLLVEVDLGRGSGPRLLSAYRMFVPDGCWAAGARFPGCRRDTSADPFPRRRESHREHS